MEPHIMNQIAFPSITRSSTGLVSLGLVSLGLLSLAACSPPAPPSSDPGPGAILAPPAPEIVIGLGDVETAMTFKATLDPGSKANNIRNQELISMRKDLAKVDVTVSRPFPEQLWLNFAITKNTVGFRKNPVLVRGAIYIDEVELKTFSYVFTNPPESGSWQERIDVLDGLEDIPKTMLVHAQADLILLKKGDPIPEDLQAVESAIDNTATIYSNPVRIDFNF